MDRNSGVDRKVSINGLSANAKCPRPKNANTSQNTGESLKRLAKGAGISLVGLVFAKVLNYGYRFLISRTGPEAYGTFSLAMAIIGFASMIAVLGLSSGVVRYVALYTAKNDVEKARGAILSSLRITGVTSILISIAVFLTAGYFAEVFHTPNLALALRIFAISIPFDALTQIFYSILLGLKRIRYYTYAQQIIPPSIKIFSALILMFLGYQLYAIIGSTIISIIFTFFITLYFLEVKAYPFLKNRHNFYSLEKELFRYSIPLAFSAFIFILMSWTDTIFLGYFKDTVAVGIYNVAVPTAQLLYIIPNAFGALFSPVLTDAYSSGNKKRMETIYKAITRWNTYFNVPLLLLLVLFSPSIINIFFGAEYVSGHTAAGILSFSVFVSSISLSAMWVLTTMKRTRYVLHSTVASAIINVILNILLIPAFGLEGAAIATLISSVVITLLYVTGVRKYSGITPFSKNMVKPVVSSVLSIFIIYFVSSYIISRSIVILMMFSIMYLIIYVAFMLAFHGIEDEDKKLINAFKSKLMRQSI